MSFVLDLQALPDATDTTEGLKPSTWSWSGCLSNASIAFC